MARSNQGNTVCSYIYCIRVFYPRLGAKNIINHETRQADTIRMSFSPHGMKLCLVQSGNISLSSSKGDIFVLRGLCIDYLVPRMHRIAD